MIIPPLSAANDCRRLQRCLQFRTAIVALNWMDFNASLLAVNRCPALRTLGELAAAVRRSSSRGSSSGETSPLRVRFSSERYAFVGIVAGLESLNVSRVFADKMELSFFCFRRLFFLLFFGLSLSEGRRAFVFKSQ